MTYLEVTGLQMGNSLGSDKNIQNSKIEHKQD